MLSPTTLYPPPPPKVTDVFGPVSNHIIDISTVSASWNTTSWTWAISEEHWNINMTPNSAALVRVMWMGEVEVRAWPLKALQEGLTKIGKEVNAVGELTTVLQALGDDGLRELATHGCKGFEVSTLLTEVRKKEHVGHLVCLPV